MHIRYVVVTTEDVAAQIVYYVWIFRFRKIAKVRWDSLTYL